MYRCEWFATALDELADIYVNADNAERDRMAGGVRLSTPNLRATRSRSGSRGSTASASPSPRCFACISG